IVIALGVLAFTYQPARHAIRTIQALARRSRTAHLAAATTGLIVVAVWTTIWQANRHTAELRPTARSETPVQCTADSYPSDVMNRPALGRFAPSSQDSSDCCRILRTVTRPRIRVLPRRYPPEHRKAFRPAPRYRAPRDRRDRLSEARGRKSPQTPL